eukprot:1592577-Ditylum_brightwellii.AAC.1
MLREVDFIMCQEKVWVLANCWEDLIDWYHKNLQHHGTEVMKRTICHNFKWPVWTAQIDRAVKVCKLCQEYKFTGQKNYRKIPLQEDKQEIELWQCMHVDLAARAGKMFEVQVQVLTAADQGTGFPKILPA